MLQNSFRDVESTGLDMKLFVTVFSFCLFLLLLLLVKLSANPQYIMQWSAIKIILAKKILF